MKKLEEGDFDDVRIIVYSDIGNTAIKNVMNPPIRNKIVSNLTLNVIIIDNLIVEKKTE